MTNTVWMQPYALEENSTDAEMMTGANALSKYPDSVKVLGLTIAERGNATAIMIPAVS
jgi:hypothetical protein